MKKRSLKTYLTVLAFLLSFTMLFVALPMQSIAEGEPVETTAADGNDGMPAETLPNPDYDPDADSTVTDPPTLEPIGNAGGGDADPMIIDPGIGGGGGISLGPVNTPLDSGVYTIVNTANQKVVDVRLGGTTAGTVVQQYTDYGSTVNRNQLFKVTYLTSINGFHYYTIRSMTNSALGLTVDSSGVVLDDIGTSDHYANVASGDRWVITVYDTGIYSIQRNNNLGGYLTTEGSTANEHQLSTAANSSTNTRWTFRKYTGEAIEGYGWNSAPTEVIPGESVTYSAYMYSTESWRNGPVTYSVLNRNGGATSCATINATTGVLSAHLPGEIQVRATPYVNAAWEGYQNVNIPIESGIIHTLENVSNDYLMYPLSNSSGAYITGSTYSFNNTSSMWKIEYVDSDYFTILNDITGYYLTAPNSNTTNAYITQTAFHETRSLWRVISSSNGYYKLQSKNQYERTTSTPLYLAWNGSYLVQSTSSTNNEWILKPLIMRLNVLYDQAFVDRFGIAEYQNVLHLVFSENMRGISIAEVLKENYGIAFRLTYTSTTCQSYPYAQYCLHKNDMNAGCEDCKNADTDHIVVECQGGLHHKSEHTFLRTFPDIYIEEMPYINILFTGQQTCKGEFLKDENGNYIRDPETGELEFIHHHNVVFGMASLLYNEVVIYTYKERNKIKVNSYTGIIATTLHELTHSMNVEDGCIQTDCIMYSDIENVEVTLYLCDECRGTADSNKFRFYNHQ